jgi:hypothetical protein
MKRRQPAAVGLGAEVLLSNAEPRKPLPGMAKKRCSRCHYWFAATEAEATSRCPDCVGLGTRPPKLA